MNPATQLQAPYDVLMQPLARLIVETRAVEIEVATAARKATWRGTGRGPSRELLAERDRLRSLRDQARERLDAFLREQDSAGLANTHH